MFGPSANEVYERLYVGNMMAALSSEYLKSLGITHLLNAPHPGSDDEVPGPKVCNVHVNEEKLAEAGINFL